MSNLPQQPTKTEIIERYWLEFLRAQKAELDKRKSSGWGVPAVPIDEDAFWTWYIENRLGASDDALRA